MAVAVRNEHGPGRRRRRARRIGGLVLLGCVLIALGAGSWTMLRDRRDRAALAMLESDDPGSRKLGAWLTAKADTPCGRQRIAAALRERTEPDVGVRESYVYALGRSARVEFFDTVAAVVRDDPDSYVRQAAWLAASRLDAGRFRELARRVQVGEYPWDRIGLACAWLEVGDPRGARELLHWAVAGDEQQRRVASLALFRGVAPLLEAAGRWPIESTVREGEPWPAELVEEVRRRCEGLDLRAIAEDTRPQVARAALIRRNVGRINNTRERIARLIGSQ